MMGVIDSLLINYFMEKITLIRQLLEVSYVTLPEDDNELSELSFDDLAMDSLEQAEFFMKLEHQLDVSIPDSVVAGMRTIGDVLAYLG